MSSLNFNNKSTIELVENIIEESNIFALKTLLESRKIFHFKNSKPLLLHEFLTKLRDQIAPPHEYDQKKCQIADCTYDLTLEKYTNIPGKNNESKVDCRNYYRGFYRKILRLIEQNKIYSQTEIEIYTARELQKLVYRNFLLSKKECTRSNHFSVRYNLHKNGKRLFLWYPSYLTAKEFKLWLKENIKELKPQEIGEQKRIQNLIDKKLKQGYQISLDDPAYGNILAENLGYRQNGGSENAQFGNTLAKKVSLQKSRNIKKLRPSIQRLGPHKIQELILHIFNDLESYDFSLSETARQYGISKATLSRFAGSEWGKEKSNLKSYPIPDLWKNTAKILANNEMFMESVISAGYYEKLSKVLKQSEFEKDGENEQ